MDSLQLLGDPQVSKLHVDVLPAKPKSLALSQPHG